MLYTGSTYNKSIRSAKIDQSIVNLSTIKLSVYIGTANMLILAFYF
jgi:hypothetical protein